MTKPSHQKVIEMLGYAIATSCLSALCYLLLTTWNGISMMCPAEKNAVGFANGLVVSCGYTSGFLRTMFDTCGLLLDQSFGEMNMVPCCFFGVCLWLLTKVCLSGVLNKRGLKPSRSPPSWGFRWISPFCV